MKKLRIKPDHNNGVPMWTLDEKKGLHWKKVMWDKELDTVKKIKDHLLLVPTIYTRKTNVPEQPTRKRPSSWILKPKLKRLKIKRSELPPSMQ